MVKAKSNWVVAFIPLDDSPQSEEYLRAEEELIKEFLQLCKDEEAFYK
jgi:hypothetical protein